MKAAMLPTAHPFLKRFPMELIQIVLVIVDSTKLQFTIIAGKNVRWLLPFSANANTSH